MWIFGYILELLSPSLTGKIFWDSVQWAAGLVMTIMFPVFAVQYAEVKSGNFKALFRLSLVTPFLFFIALLTDQYHHLYYPNPQIEQIFLFAELTYDFTWIVYAYSIYGYIATMIGIGILGQRLLRPHRLYRWQILTVIFGFLFPVVFTVLTIAGVKFVPFRDVSPFTFAIGNLIVSWGLFRYKLFDVVPIARDVVLENIEDLVVVLDKQDRIVDINQKALRFLKMSSGEVIGQPAEKVYQNVPNIIERFQKPENVHVQLSLDLDNKRHHFDVTSSLLYDKQQNLIGRIFVANDITTYIEMQDELKTLNEELEGRVQRRTQELSRSTERYRAVVENQSEFIARWKPDRTRTFVNEAYCRYYGISYEEALKTDFMDLIHEDDRPAVLAKIARIEKGETDTETNIHRAIKPDGSIGWNEWTDTAIRNKNGEIVEFQSVGRDITERKNAEDALALSEEKFQKAFNTTPALMTIEDDQGVFLDVNRAFLDTFGYKRTDVIGRKASGLDFVYDADDLITLRKISQEHGRLKDFESRIRRKSGEISFVSLSSDIFYIEGIKYTVTSGLDITERKETERVLAEAYDTTLEGWARALELRDKETEGHTRRVTDLTIKLAKACGVPAEQLDDIRRGAILHDIGKLAISDRVLLSPGKLTSDQWRVMSQHPWIGYKLLEPISYLENALDIVLYHHERWDGSGYPKGLQGEEIPLPARIFAIVDVWDAIQSERPYKRAWSRDEALELIKESAGKHFDPKLTKIFLELVQIGEVEDLK